MGSYITLINGKHVLFKIDTGVDVSVIPEAVFKQSQGVTLNPTDCCLTGPGQNQMVVSSQFTDKPVHQNSVADEQIILFVVTQHQKSLLGRHGILALDFIGRIHALQEMDKFVIISTAVHNTILAKLQGQCSRAQCRELFF